MGTLDRSLWQWNIRRPGTIDWRPLGRSMTETEARQWALANGYEIRRGAAVEAPARILPDEPPPAPPRRRRELDSSF